MVFCGKPSKACSECRIRRTKCDTKRPCCSQCTRAGRTCNGYRDPSDLMFRDESKRLSAKRQRKAAKIDGSSTLPPSTTDDKVALQPTPSTLVRQQLGATDESRGNLHLELGSSADEQATCFFFRNYVLADDKFHNGNFQYLQNIYATETIGDALAESVASLGMVGLSNFWKASSIMVNANIKYNSALKLVSSRLRNFEEGKSDQTLVSVMLLGLFETNTCNSPQSMKSWTKHITGAAAILSLRGKKQLQTPIGRHLFVHLRTQLITNCIQRHAHIPATISEWSTYASRYETPEEAASSSLAAIAIKYCNLRASLSSFRDDSDSENTIATLCAIDAEYEDWVTRCPIEFFYNTITLNQPSEDVFSDNYHIYSSIWIATAWNHYRCVRILVNELLLHQLARAVQNSQESASQLDKMAFYKSQIFFSNATLLQLSHDICSSVPFYLGYSANQGERISRAPPKAVSGNLLLWPLYTAGVTGLTSDMMREWVIGRLRMISDVMGIRQAGPLADTLTSMQDILEWQEGQTGQVDEAEVLSY